MIEYDLHTLDNGLRVILLKDDSTALVSVNMLYGVGAKDESPERTGFAHLFEHLMFGGSKNFPEFDKVVEENAGESNAFTNNDYTNYYITLPSTNLEMALRLESDRMNNLLISQKSLDVQKNVVIEEYKQRYLNQPYGDVWMLIRELSYKVHPYRWSTIGKDISHIEKTDLEYVKNFYSKYYIPNNAILCIAGNIVKKNALELCEKYFGKIEKGKEIQRERIIEPIQTQKRELRVKRDVPQSVIYISFPMSSRLQKEYYAFDLLSDILSNGRSSRLYNRLVKQEQLFTEVNAFITGDVEEGLFVLTGKYRDEVSLEMGKDALIRELSKLSQEVIDAYEFEKVKNKFESTMSFSQIKNIDRAMNLCYFEHLGDIELINKEIDNYQGLEIKFVQEVAKKTFIEEKSNILYYESK
ncbi:MAG: pitrilysin family protein [Bacteroidales bacterium]|nr:pitrilysin family protein [Bacteroidales bacterium]MDD4703007.1 pitrilysin family protein [Bacteroidales bacterium]